MGNIKILIMIIVALLLSISLFFFLKAYSFKKVSVDNFDSSITDFSAEGFVLNGNISFYNAGVLPVKIEEIDYTVYLDEEVLIEGKIEGLRISPKKSSVVDIKENIKWAPALDVAAKMLLENETYISIDGTARLDYGFIIKHDVSFSEDVDIRPYLLDIAKENIGSIIDKGIGLIGGILDGLKRL